MRRIAPAFCFTFLVACGSSSAGTSTPPAAFTGTPGQPIAVTNVTDVLVVDLSVNGVKGSAIVDTGSPVVVLDPGSFVDANLPDGPGPVDSLVVGALTFPNADVLGANLITSPDPTIPVGGSLGCAVLCDFALSLDYRDSEITLGTGALPANVESPGASVPFALMGGGSVEFPGVPGVVLFPISRVMVTVTVEGTEHTFAVDSGSSFVTVRQSIFNGLVADGRTTIGGVGTATVGMASTSALARMRSLVVGGVEIDGAVMADDPAIDQTLDEVATEIGEPIDGLVGGSFLRNFFVTVDYPTTTLQLQRYTKGAPTFDLFDRVGIGITPSTDGASPSVAGVFAGTDAAKLGLATGDVVVSIDGHPLAKLGSSAIDTLLAGPLGSTKTLELGAASSASLSMKTITVGVNDILAL